MRPRALAFVALLPPTLLASCAGELDSRPASSAMSDPDAPDAAARRGATPLVPLEQAEPDSTGDTGMEAENGADQPTSTCRSTLSFVPAHDAPVATPLATAPRVLGACEALAASSRKRAARFIRPLSDEGRAETFDPLVRCYSAGEGAWTFEITSGRSTRTASDDGDVFALSVRPVFIQPNGITVASAVELQVTSGTAHFVLVTALRAPRTFDWDGDGRAELYFEQVHAQEENNAWVSRGDRFWIFTARGGVREFNSAAMHANRIEDMNGDGRPDMVLESPWITAGPCGISEVYYPGPEVLLHSLPGGSFSSADSTAQGFLAHQCRARPERVISASAIEKGEAAAYPPFLIGCARWWGRSAESIKEEIERTYPPQADGGGDLGCFPRKELLRAALIDPPTDFRLTCP
jgi:hypothetical protein